MCKKLAFLVSIVVVLGLVGSALAVEYTWTNAVGGDDSWCTPGNWKIGAVPATQAPGPNDTVIIHDINDGPTVDCDANVVAVGGDGPDEGTTVDVDIAPGGKLVVQNQWNWRDGEGDVNISVSGELTILGNGGEGDMDLRTPDNAEGTYNIYDGANIFVCGGFRGSDETEGFVTYNMSGGDVNVGFVKIGDEGSGNFYFTGGTLRCSPDEDHRGGEDAEAGDFEISGREASFFEVFIDGGAQLICERFRAPLEPMGGALIYLDDGYIECSEWDAAGTWWILDINEGMLRITEASGTQKQEDIQNWIDIGQITGYDGAVIPLVTTDGADIVVTCSFVHRRAYDSSPGHNATDLCPIGVQLSWAPGEYCVADHNVYFGTSLSDVNESATPAKEHHDSNSWTPPGLQLDATYYWRVDEVNDACNTSPWTGAIWQFTTENGQAYDPSPGDGQRNALPGSILEWTPCCAATSQNFYFGADFPESIVLFDDGFEAGVDPNWTPGGWVQHDATIDSNYSHSGSYSAKAVDAGVKTLTCDDVNASYYTNAIEVRFWVRRTEDVNEKDELKLYYYNGTSYDYVDDFNVVALGPNDAWHEFTDTITDSNYLISNFRIRLVADLDAGDTVYVDDVTISNAWPVNPIWLEATLGGADNNYPAVLTQGNNYYWRIDTNDDNNIIQGDFWNCAIGVGGLIMYYNFDGGLGGDLPSPITDNSDNNIKFWKYPGSGGSLKYGESNPVIDASTTSADFDPCVGLYRPDPGEFDPLRLDGYQYTIEMWVKPENLSEDLDVDGDDPNEDWLDDAWDIVLIGKYDSWMIGIQDPCDNDSFQWEHAGNGESMEENTAVEGEWVHLAVVYDRTDPDEERMKFYLNGVLKEETDETDLNPADNNYPVTIGYAQKDDVNVGRFFDGLIDEVRIYDIALTPCEFLLFPGDEWASCPSPYSGEAEIDPCTVTLMWTRGQGAVTHDIYFGTDFDDVNDGTALVETSWAPNSWTPPEILGNGTVYYWRVDTYDSGGPPPYRGVVWQFITKYVIEDEHLILHYKFDESMSDRALDASGHGYHGDVDDGEGGWDPTGGQYDGCRIFDDDTAVLPPPKVTTHLITGVSVSVWLNGQEDQDTDKDHVILDVSTGENAPYAMRVVVPDEDGDVLWRAGDDSCDVLLWDTATPRGWEGDWHHLVFTKDEAAGTMKIYFDGFLMKTKSPTKSTLSNLRYRPFKIGAYIWESSSYEGRMDDLRIYDYAIPESKVLELFRGGDLTRAWKPKPYDGRPDAPPTSDLSWEPGDYVADVNGHEVYFGTNKQEVTDANNSWPVGTSVYKGKQDPCTYELPPLDLTVTYYWRIDEVNDACDPNGWTGKIWRFRVADYIVVDNFDDDTAQDPPQNDWNKGTVPPTSGAQITLRSTPPVIGEHSMRYYYTNHFDYGYGWGYYSEIQTISLEPNDWDYYDIRVISLWFYGKSGNAATIYEQMNLGLEDDSNYAVVLYGGPGAPEGEEITDVQIEDWQLWEVLTNRFTNINFSDVNKICIGFGFRNNWTDPGMSSGGTVFFDEINLYVPTCRPELLAQEGDLNEDCTVDWEDVEIMADDWLETDVNLNPVQAPGEANLVGWWKLDEEPDSNVTDYAGYDNNGVIETLYTNVFWADAGHDGNALRFDGGRVLVPDANALKPKYELTVCAWIKYSDKQDNSRIVVKGADNRETFGLEIDEDDECTFLVRDGNYPDAEDYNKYDVNSHALEQGAWNHLAGTYDGDTVKCYINGELAATNNDVNIGAIVFLSQNTADLAIGNRSDSKNRPFEGLIDDVRVYDRALSAAEIAYIATDETGIFTVQSAANIYNLETLGDRIVNLKDYAKLADNWLKRRLWPE